MTDSAQSSDFSLQTQSLLKKGVSGAFLGQHDRSQFDNQVKPQPQPQSKLQPQPKPKQQSSSSSQFKTSDKLDVLEEVLADYPGLAAAEVQAQAQSQAQTSSSIGPRKETLEGVGVSPLETGATIQQVEPEKSPEIPPEVDKFIKQTDQLEDQKPKEVVIAESAQDLPNQDKYQSQPVIVLPITPELEKKGARKSPKFSVRWLVEWSKKIIKMFAGKVIYRSVDAH